MVVVVLKISQLQFGFSMFFSKGGYLQVGVSKNNGTPKWMVYNGKPYEKWMIWWYPYFWKHLSGGFFHCSAI